MTNLRQAQVVIADLLKQMPDRPESVEVLVRKNKDLDSDIDAKLAELGMCMSVLPLHPLECLQRNDGVVFYPRVEIRVRVIETPALNEMEEDAEEIGARVALHLAGKNPGELFEDNLQQAPTPYEMEGVFDEETSRMSINYDVIFHAPLHLQQFTS